MSILDILNQLNGYWESLTSYILNYKLDAYEASVAVIIYIVIRIAWKKLNNL